MKVIVSDMGGVLYSFDSTFDPIVHEENFSHAIEALGKKGLSTKEQLEGEWLAVKSGRLVVYPQVEGVSNLLASLNKFKLVIVSTSLVKTSNLILQKVGLGGKAWKVFDMSDFGSKKDPEAWKKIFQTLPSIDVIAEDSDKNLAAAAQAAVDLGFKPQTFTEMSLL